MKTDLQPIPFSTPLEAIVFDCDGVLFDSKDANVRFYSHILKHVGAPPVQPDQEEYIHMHPVRESLVYLLGRGQVFQEAWSYVQQIDYHDFNQYLQPEPGLVHLLQAAKSSFKTALATNRTVSTREVLAYFDLEKYFDLVVSASDVNHPKPHPEAMGKILETFVISPEQVLFIGDSAVDEAFAAASGVYFVAYKNPKLKAHLHIGHFQELHSVLAAQMTLPGV